ncbi:MAG: SDR family NAD(P)-dependent oxidoreductase [Propionibacteriaceae bacterium]
MNLKDRTTLVIGGGGLFGSEIARLFTEHGAQVVTADRSAGSDAEIAIDIAATESVDAAVARAAEQLGGRIDILVNAAGVLREDSTLAMPDAHWREMVEINLTGTMRTCRAVLPGMVDRRWGRIINVSSQLGLKGGADMAHYAATKAGVIGYTKSLALEVSRHNVLANVIAPGPFNTPMLGGVSATWKERKMAELPLGRFGEPAEVAPTALLLASDPGGNLYVGQTLGPNSGDVMP